MTGANGQGSPRAEPFPDARVLLEFRVYVPPPARCTDNAAMIAAAGYYRLARGDRDGLALDAVPSAPLPRRT